MAIKPIITVPDQRLYTKCLRIEKFDSHLKSLVKDLLDTVAGAKEPEGAGLAAPQLGITQKVCVVRKFTYDEEDTQKVTITDHVLINPEIIKTSKETELDWEACLSVPQQYGKVVRPKKIKITSYDLSGNKKQINAAGFFARVILHEIDHLDGILFTDRVIGKLINEDEFKKLQSEYSY